MASRDVLSRVWAMAETVAGELGLEIIDVEQTGGRTRQTFRLFVEKPEGVGLADCERMSRSLSERLEEENTIDFPFVLEVSSPGMERPLRKAADFRRYVGRRISVRLRGREGKNGSRNFTGILKDIEGDVVTVEIGSGETRTFQLSGIAKANLKVDWDSFFKEKGIAENQ